ncbi:BTB/POZ domain-containing protein 6-B isoform X2 [Frankliniella occidentalis]|uniref:BTB/POZ domain-containing protein 6-B isoform X2 n=1 Tax=Frankliniella occidentalis TaxID=133901 RepID=A0A6J1SX31_FRAOC|nr:BTB/POZ domain-containing protein 6-B isoform X2 [Frankliniella occidentalis]
MKRAKTENSLGRKNHWQFDLSLQPSTKLFRMASGEGYSPSTYENNRIGGKPDNSASSRNGASSSNNIHDSYGSTYDWQVTKTTIRERGQQLLETGQWSDCKFIVGTEPHQQAFEGHKVFLAMSSPVFEAMFFGGMAEKDGAIHIFDVQPEGFKALLEYIYSDKISLRSFDQACELCYVAKKYMLPHLVRECTKYIWRDICPDNACRAYEFAKLFEEPDLMEKSLEVISSKTKEVLAESSFEEVELATIQAVLDQEELTIDSELELFDALQRWAIRECARKGLPPSDGKALRSVLHGTVGKIRFLTLSPSQFAERPAVSQLLSQDEAFAILVNISSPNTTTLSLPLPEGFTSSRVPRKKIPEPEIEPESKLLPFRAPTLFCASTSADVALPKMYCLRSPLPGQPPPPIYHSTILDSTLQFTVDRDICILGAQVPTQIESIDGQYVRRERSSYTELLYAHLLDSNGARLTYTHLTSRVNYGQFMEISFNRHIFIQRNKVYRVGVVLNKGGSYPAGAYTETAVCDGVLFKFNVGNPNDSIRDGLIHSIVFRHI